MRERMLWAWKTYTHSALGEYMNKGNKLAVGARMDGCGSEPGSLQLISHPRAGNVCLRTSPVLSRSNGVRARAEPLE